MCEVFTEILPARKSSKKSAINWRPVSDAGFVVGVLTVHTDKASAAYTVSEFSTGWAGRGITFKKLTAGTDAESESYSVFCATDRPAADTCECKGFQFTASKGAGTCKHIDSARALIANGWL